MTETTTSTSTTSASTITSTTTTTSCLKCLSCAVDIPWTLRNEHYRSEWHRYNVKRKCANLPPIPQSLFETKLQNLVHKRMVEQAHQTYRYAKKNYQFDDNKSHDLMRKPVVQTTIPTRESLQPGTFPPPRRVLSNQFLKYRCKLCKKDFKTKQQCESHLQTRKHAMVFYDYQQMLQNMPSTSSTATTILPLRPTSTSTSTIRSNNSNNNNSNHHTLSSQPSQSPLPPSLSEHEQQDQQDPNQNQNQNNQNNQDPSSISSNNNNNNNNIKDESSLSIASDIDNTIHSTNDLLNSNKKNRINRRDIVINTNIENNDCVDILQVKRHVPKRDIPNIQTIHENDNESENMGDWLFSNLDDSDKKIDFMKMEMLDQTRCLFCTQNGFTEFEQNLEHMQSAHGFFIPLPHRLISLEGLIDDAYEIVGVDHQCTWCWHKFKSLRAVQAHMRDCGHCKLNLDRGPAVYDINKYDSENKEEKEKLDIIEEGDSIFIRHYQWGKYNNNNNNDDNDNRQIMPYDESESLGMIVSVNDMDELVRKDGTVIGHRDFALLYKQKPRDYTYYKSNEQIIAEVNNPNKRFILEEAISQQRRQKELKVASIEQMKEFKKHKEDSNIEYDMRSHKLHIDQFKNQNRILY